VPPAGQWRNWAGNHTRQVSAVVRPETRSEVVDAVRAAARRRQRVKATGAGYSSSGLAATSGVQLDMTRYQRVLEVDRRRRWITVQGGITLHRLDRVLANRGMALPLVGYSGAPTVAGAISTGTHGAGVSTPGLAAHVEAIELITAGGEIVRCSAGEEADVLAAARVGLGALGVVSTVTLRCVPAFALRVTEGYGDLGGLAAALTTAPFGDGYWLPAGGQVLVRVGETTSSPPGGRGPAAHVRHRLTGGRLGPGVVAAAGAHAPIVSAPLARWSGAGRRRRYTDRKHRVLTPLPEPRYVESSWAVPLADIAGALEGLSRWRRRARVAVAHPVRITATASDTAWLSPAYERPTAYVSARAPAGDHHRWFAGVGEVMAGHGGRPHWAGIHGYAAGALSDLYPRWEDWQAVRYRLDPAGVFANDELDVVVGPPA
jgi:FAD/FMN-containing dehydrogenase